MNTFAFGNSSLRLRWTESGSTLLEVLLAIVIFVVGMLALASLQGNLTRSSSDSNMRTVAANIAEETIEGLRAFEVIETEAGKKAYDDIVDKTITVQRGGVDYTVVVDVNDYYFLDDRVSVTKDIKEAPAGVTASSFKNIDLTVTWNGELGFHGVKDDPNTPEQREDMLGSGSMEVSSIIPAILSLNNARVAAEDDGKLGYPPVGYTPGEKPEIISISLGDNKFKESTTPDPEVVRNDELVETWFDVITYSGTGNDAVFLRREEFASISCECTLRAASGSGEDGRQPTTWNGAEYDEGEKVGKPFGESASNQQSQYCDVCCNDHHDTSRGPDSYRPGTSQANGNHAHYGRKNGVLTEATVGKDYIEACRLVRKDGFFRVAQDFNLESQTAFPENYLDETQEVDDYSSYVTDAVDDHFTGNGNGSWPAHNLNFDGREVANPSAMTSAGTTSQQLRSRGIYVDAATPALLQNIVYCFNDDGTPKTPPDNEDCPVKSAKSPLELYPFFDVQLTLLADWKESPLGDPVSVTSQPLATDNTHSRGLAALAKSKVGLSTVDSGIETGNVGLISIASIASEPTPQYSHTQLYVSANGGVTPPTVNATVSGNIGISIITPNFSPSVEGGSGATCKPEANKVSFTCSIDPTATTPTLTVGNYAIKSGKNYLDLRACSSSLTLVSYTSGKGSTTTFYLPLVTTSGIAVIIDYANCP